jgi:hypothetical protein
MIVLNHLDKGAAGIIQPWKLDRRIRQIAGIVNGGLSEANLASSYILPASMFTEARTRFLLTARQTNSRIPTVTTYLESFATTVPAACEILFVEVLLHSVNTISGTDVFTARLYDVNQQYKNDLVGSWGSWITRADVPVRVDSQPYGGVYQRRFTCTPGNASNQLAAGEHLRLRHVDNAGGEQSGGIVTYHFAIAQEA